MDRDQRNSREARLARAVRLIQAIEDGDAVLERELTEDIGRDSFNHVKQELARLTQELHRALGSVSLTDELSRLAHRELPIAQVRLTQVVEMMEGAAHQTLEAVEAALPAVDRLAMEAGGLQEQWPPGRSMGAAYKARLRSLLDSVAGDAALLKEKLSDVLVAQGYQDITGQIIRPVVGLITELEGLLLGSDDAEPSPASSAGRCDRRGNGPVLRGHETEHTVTAQEDVDDLLSRFGV